MSLGGHIMAFGQEHPLTAVLTFRTNGYFLTDTTKNVKWLLLVGRPSLAAASRRRARRPAPL